MKQTKLTLQRLLIVTLIGLIAFGSNLFAGERTEKHFKGSIRVKRGVNYTRLAKISILDVNRTIMNKYPKSTVKSISLQEENGYLVYGVLLITNGKHLDVKVDAGNGKIVKVDNDMENGNAVENENQNENNDDNNKQSPMYKSSISITGSQERTMYSLAKISINDAINSATSKFYGKVVKVSLDNENGSLIYSVGVAGSNGKITDVKIDAGNGKILSSDSGGDKEELNRNEKGNETNENENSED